MLSGGDVIEDFYGGASGEQVVADEESFEEVPAEPVGFLYGEPVRGRHVIDRRGERGAGIKGARLLLAFSSSTRLQIGSCAVCCRAPDKTLPNEQAQAA